jgi:hypothetical protein
MQMPIGKKQSQPEHGKERGTVYISQEQKKQSKQNDPDRKADDGRPKSGLHLDLSDIFGKQCQDRIDTKDDGVPGRGQPFFQSSHNHKDFQDRPIVAQESVAT